MVNARLSALGSEATLFDAEEIEARSAFEAATVAGDDAEMAVNALRLRSFAESRATRELAHEHLMTLHTAAQGRLESGGYYAKQARREQLADATVDTFFGAVGDYERQVADSVARVRRAVDDLWRARDSVRRAHQAALDADLIGVAASLKLPVGEVWAAVGRSALAAAVWSS